LADPPEKKEKKQSAGDEVEDEMKNLDLTKRKLADQLGQRARQTPQCPCDDPVEPSDK